MYVKFTLLALGISLITSCATNKSNGVKPFYLTPDGMPTVTEVNEKHALDECVKKQYSNGVVIGDKEFFSWKETRATVMKLLLQSLPGPNAKSGKIKGKWLEDLKSLQSKILSCKTSSMASNPP